MLDLGSLWALAPSRCPSLRTRSPTGPSPSSCSSCPAPPCGSRRNLPTLHPRTPSSSRHVWTTRTSHVTASRRPWKTPWKTASLCCCLCRTILWTLSCASCPSLCPCLCLPPPPLHSRTVFLPFCCSCALCCCFSLGPGSQRMSSWSVVRGSRRFSGRTCEGSPVRCACPSASLFLHCHPCPCSWR